jgi:hypothetical protein
MPGSLPVRALTYDSRVPAARHARVTYDLLVGDGVEVPVLLEVGDALGPLE